MWLKYLISSLYMHKFPDFSYLPFFEREVPEGGRVKVLITISLCYPNSKIRLFSTVSLSDLQHITTYHLTPNAGRVATTTGHTEGILLTTDKSVDGYFTSGGGLLHPKAVGGRNAFGVFNFVDTGTGYRVAHKINAAFVASLF